VSGESLGGAQEDPEPLNSFPNEDKVPLVSTTTQRRTGPKRRSFRTLGLLPSHTIDTATTATALAADEFANSQKGTSGVGIAFANDVAYLQSEIYKTYPNRRRSRYIIHLWYNHFDPEVIALAAAAAIFSKAFMETLGHRAGDGAANLPKQVRDLARSFHRNRGAGEIRIRVEGQATAIVVVTADLPDGARLALLDLDVTTEELRGKPLRWNTLKAAWLPDDTSPVELNNSRPPNP
jgi:hypothetical protein